MGTVFEHGLGNLDVARRGLDFLGEVDVEVLRGSLLGLGRRFGDAQPACHQGQCGTLHYKAHQRAEEDDVEHHVAVWETGGTAGDGEDDGHGAAQPHPRDEETVAQGVFAERSQREKYAQGAGDENHHEADDEARHQHLLQLAGVHQQTKGEEHRELCQPGDAVEEVARGAPVDELAVAHHQTGDVDGQVAVAPHVVGGGEDEERARQNQDRVEGGVVDVYLVDHPHQRLAEEPSSHGSHGQLHHQHGYGAAPLRRATLLHQADECKHQDVGHRVVGAALQLQRGAQVVLEVQPASAQDGEDRCRVGAAHGGGQ